MTQEKTNRRAWVKNAAIIFLSVLLVLTFFSNTIRNYSLPVVSAQYPNYGTITARIRGTGTLSSNETFNVTVDQTREVRSVAVRVGDTVTEGQTLFVLADQESDELKAANTALTAANYDYQTFLLDISASDTNVVSAQQALNRAKNDRDKAYSDYTKASGELSAAKKAVEDAQTAYDSVKTRVDQAELALEAASKVFDDADLALTKATANLELLQGELTAEQEALKKPLDDATTDLENARLLLSTATTEKEFQEEKLGMTYEAAITARDGAQDTITDLESQIYSKRQQVSSINSQKASNNQLIDSYWDVFEVYYDEAISANENYREVIQNLKTEIENYNILITREEANLVRYSNDEDEENVEKTLAAIRDYQDKLDECQDTLRDYVTSADAAGYLTRIETLTADNDTLNTELSTLTADIATLNSQLERAQRTYDDAVSVISDRGLRAAMEDYEDASAQVKELQILVNEETIRYNNTVPNDSKEISDAKNEVTRATGAKTQAQYDQTAAQKAYDRVAKELTEPETVLNQAKADLEAAETAAKADLSTFDNAVQDAQLSLQTAVESSDISDAKQLLDLEQKKKAIDDAQAEVDRLIEEAAPQEILSTRNGTITAVNVSSGDKTDPATALATIEVAERGYTLQITVDADQARKVSVGDKAELTNSWYYSNMDITLISILSDRDSNGQRKILNFSVTGDDITPGQSLSISIGQRSENYDAIIPKNAVREDSNGFFALVVEVKSSPLGNRYVARRLDISKLAEDDTNAAVSGMTGSEFVIVTSTSPVEPGMLVRLSED